MDERSLSALQAYRPKLRKQWAARLRAAPVTSPLAHPDALVHLMEWTLDELFRELRSGRRHTVPANNRIHAFPCSCGLNPLLVYFETAHACVVEAVNVCSPHRAPFTQGDVHDVTATLDVIAHREISLFCALCVRNARRGSHHGDPLRLEDHECEPVLPEPPAMLTHTQAPLLP